MTDRRSDGNTISSDHMHIYSVGDVCAILGMTRKTLFYYDRIGLALPSGRIGTQGYKVYDEAALMRLRKIADYRQAGLSVEEIRLLLEPDCHDRSGILHAAFQRLSAEQELLGQKIRHLETLLEKEKQAEPVSDAVL